MNSREHIDNWLERAGEQIRWKRARAPLLDELEAHIADERDALLEQGVSADEAEHEAVLRMGDPVSVGTELDRVHRPKPDWAVLLCAAAMTALGTVLVYAACGAESGGRMLLMTLLGAGAMAVGYFADYTLLAKYARPIFYTYAAVCLAFAVVGGGHMLGLGNSDTLVSRTVAQLSYGLPLPFAAYVYTQRMTCGEVRRERVKKYGRLALAVLLCELAVFLSASSIQCTVYITVACAAVLIYAFRRGWIAAPRLVRVAMPLIVAALALLLCLTYSGEAHLRLIKAITPYSDPYTYGYPSVLNREMMYTARFIGEGGAGSLGFADAVVPRQGNEWFMLPYLAHRFGWIVPAAVVVLFAALTALMLRGIRRQSSVLGGLTGFAIVMCFVIRAAFYFLTSFGMVIFEAEGLPLFSSCGKLAILDMFMLGVLLSVFRTGDITRDNRVSQTE